MRLRNQRGAAAVEFALVIPVLLLLVFGTIEFARLYNEQVTLTNAARTAARTMSIANDQVTARTAAIGAAPGLTPALLPAQITFAPAACLPGGTTSVTVSYTAPLLTGWFGVTLPLRAEAEMTCEG